MGQVVYLGVRDGKAILIRPAAASAAVAFASLWAIGFLAGSQITTMLGMSLVVGVIVCVLTARYQSGIAITAGRVTES